MPDMKEVYEMVTQQTPPKLDALDRQRKRQTRTVRNRKVGAFGVAAVIAILTLVVGVQIANNEPKPGPAITPTPPVETGSDLYVVDPETGETTLLLAARGNQTNPERSPDGTRVVYQSTVAGSPPQIFVLEADGTQRQLTTLEQGAQDPTWSPDGRQIAFAGRGSDADIFVMNADGSRIRKLAGTPEHDSHPDWSPDGSRIVFDSRFVDRRNGLPNGLIWMASIRTGTLTQLTQDRTPLERVDPAWSPDGRWIAYSTPYPGSISAELWLVRPDGTQKHPFGYTAPLGHLRQNPSWSPDGRSIVFEDNNSLGAGGSIYIIDVETGEDSVRFVPTEGGESFPSWDTEGILFSRIGSD